MTRCGRKQYISQEEGRGEKRALAVTLGMASCSYISLHRGEEGKGLANAGRLFRGQLKFEHWVRSARVPFLISSTAQRSQSGTCSVQLASFGGRRTEGTWRQEIEESAGGGDTPKSGPAVSQHLRAPARLLERRKIQVLRNLAQSSADPLIHWGTCSAWLCVRGSQGAQTSARAC